MMQLPADHQPGVDTAEDTEPRFSPYTDKLEEPWAELAHDRAHCPVVWSPHLNAVQITSYAGVTELLQNADAYTGAYSTLWPMEEPLSIEKQVFSAADPPRHTRQRRLFVKAMSASRIQHMRPFSERLANDLVDEIVAAGDTFELGSAYARRISEGHLAELLGLPEDGRERFLYPSSMSGANAGNWNNQKLLVDMNEWLDRLADILRTRRAAGVGSDDLITLLCFAEEGGDRFDELEVAAMLGAMIRAGSTSTAVAIVNIVYALENHPEQKARYLADIDGLTMPLVQEGLRYDGPALGMWRRCAQDTTIQNFPVQKGDRLFTVYAAANHDPAAFDRPDEFIVDRDWAKLPPHLSFGYGIHHCLGMNLALLECTVALATLYRRLPNLRLRPGSTPSQAPGPVSRSWLNVEMEYDRGVYA